MELKLFLSFWLWRATTGGHLPGKALSIVAGGAWASYLHGEDEEDSHRHRLINNNPRTVIFINDVLCTFLEGSF